MSVKKCRQCDLVFADPQPVPKDFSAHYGDPDDYWSSDYFSADPNYFAVEIAEAKALLPFKAGMQALDIGAGIGKAMNALDFAGFEAWGLEPSAKFRDAAIERGIAADRLQLGGIDDVDFPSEKFDFITFGAVLEHLYSPADALQRALGWLKPGGIIQLEVPSSAHLVARLVNLYFRMRGTTFVTNTSPMHAPYHLFEFGLRSFRLNGTRSGYEIARHRFSVCTIYHLPTLLHPLLRWYMERTDTGMQLTAYLRRTSQPRVEQ